MLGVGVAARTCQRSAEREASAVQQEMPLQIDLMEDLLLKLGVRMGMLQADRSYAEAFRSMELGDGHEALRGHGSANIVHTLAPHLLAWRGELLAPTHVSGPTTATHDERTPGAAGAAPAADPGLQSAATLLPPFALSWRQPMVKHSGVTAHGQAGSSNILSESSETEALASVGAPAMGAAAASRAGPQPAPPLHLGLGIMVGGMQPIRSPAAGGEIPSVEEKSGPPPMVSGQLPKIAAVGADGSSSREPQPPMLSHSFARAQKHFIQLFRPRRRDAAMRGRIDGGRFGGPLPVLYTRDPGSLACGTAFAFSHQVQQQQQQQQQQLGKRTREIHQDGYQGVPDNEDDLGQLGYDRGRPRPHTAGSGLQIHPRPREQQWQEMRQDHEDQQQPGQAAGLLPSGEAAIHFGGDGAFRTATGSGLGGGGLVVADGDHHGAFARTRQSTLHVPAVPQPTEPSAETAPFGELLYGIQRIGHDLCRRAKNPSGSGGKAAVAAWIRVLVKMLDQLRRLLEARSAVSKYDTGRQLGAEVSPRPIPPLANHMQLRAAVQLLLVVTAELPPSKLPRVGLAPEALDAIDYLLCSSPFVDFDGCDPQARAILVDGVLKLARLAAVRSGRESTWGGVRDRALQTLLGWLVRQSEVIRHLSTPSLDCTAGNKLGGLSLSRSAEGLAALSDKDRLTERLAVQTGHMELFRTLAVSLSVFAVYLRPPLALQILDPEVVAALMQPLPALPIGPTASIIASSLSLDSPLPLSREAQRANALILLHAAVLAVLPSGPNAICLADGYDAVQRSGLRTAAEGVLLSESRSADKLLQRSQEATACLEVVVPLLGTLYALLLSRSSLANWAAVESAIHAAATEGSSPAYTCPLRWAWEAPADRRCRSLSLYLYAQVVRALGWMGQDQQHLPAAFRCDPPSPAPGHGPRLAAGDQLGLAGVWLRAALDCGNRPMLAGLTAELLRCGYTRRLLGCRGPARGSTVVGLVAGSKTVSAGVRNGVGDAASSDEVEALASAVALSIIEDVDGVTCAQLATALISGLLREQRSADVRAALCGLDITWRALRRELSRNGGLRGAGSGFVPAPRNTGAGVPCDVATQGPGSATLAASGVPAGTLRAHRAMACVALAALEACAMGSLAGMASGAGGGGLALGLAAAQRAWAEQQGPARVLECVAEMLVEDTAVLVRWEVPSVVATVSGREEHAARWAHWLRTESSAGLLSDLAAVLARSTDCRTDYSSDPAHHPGEHSVLQRCLVLLCLMVSELPPAGEAHAHTNQLLRDHIAASVLDHLCPTPAADEPAPTAHGNHHGQHGPGLHGWDLCAAQANLGRMLHRCIAGSLRICIVEGLKVPVPQSAPARHAVNSLAWLRSLLRHPAMQQEKLLERLLPPLLNLIVESLVTARTLLLAKAHLHYDIENTASDTAPSQGQPQSQHQAPLPLIRELLLMADAVLEAASASGLMASKDEAYGALPGSVRIDASPLLLMEPAPRNQLRAAAGFAAGLLLRTCLECFALPLEMRHQKALLSRAKPPEEERSVKVRLRLASYFGNPPALSEAEQPKAVRQARGSDVLKLSAAPAAADGADGPLKLSEVAIECMARLTRPWDDAAYLWAGPVVEAIRHLRIETKGAGLQYTKVQKTGMYQLLLEHHSRRARWLQQSQPHGPMMPRHVHPMPPVGQRQQESQQRVLQHDPSKAPERRAVSALLLSQLQECGAPSHLGPGTAGGVQRGPDTARQQQQQQPGSPVEAPSQSSPIQRFVSPNLMAIQSASLQRRSSTSSQGHFRAAASVLSPVPSIWPGSHYVAAVAIKRSEDHRVRLSGCVPFAHLRTLLLHDGRQPSQLDGNARLPPLVGELVDAKLHQLRQLRKPVLQCTLRDASVDVAKALCVMIVGPPDILSMILSDVAGRHVMVGMYGAVHLGGNPTTSDGAAASAAAGALPAWPLRMKLSLDTSASRGTTCGLVVEPRTEYVTWLRRALRARDNCTAAPTLLAATPATGPLAPGPAAPKEGASSVPSQEPTGAAKAVLGQADGGPVLPVPQVQLSSPVMGMPGTAGGHLEHRDAAAPVFHQPYGPSSGQAKPGDTVTVSDVVTTTALRKTRGDILGAESGRVLTAAAPVAFTPGGFLVEAHPGRLLAEGTPGQISSQEKTAGGVTAVLQDAVEDLEPVDLAWRGILAASCPAGCETKAPALKQQGCELFSAITWKAEAKTIAEKLVDKQGLCCASTVGGRHCLEGRGGDMAGYTVPETQLGHTVSTCAQEE